MAKGTSTEISIRQREIISDGSYSGFIGLFKSAMKSETAPYIKEKPQKRNLKRITIKEQVLRKPILKESL
jgi:hypothetical protein